MKPLAQAAMIAAVVATLVAAMSLAPSDVATAQEPFDVRDHYVKSEYMVPMRDGVELFTIVYTPSDTSKQYPIMLFRTPYSIGPYGPDAYRSPLGPTEQFDRDGYIFVFQDARGTYRSGGTFQVIKPLNGPDAAPDTADESTDNYDTIEWVLSNIPNHNGRVGQWGISYPGWQTVMGMVNAHPALQASSPQASPSDMFIGDDWHHNGAFRLMYAFAWLSNNARRRDQPTEQRNRRFDYGTPWGYDFFLDIGPLANINELFFHNDVPAWNEFMEHGAYDDYWQNQNALVSLEDITHPVLNVAGWFDAEDFYGPTSIYYTLEETNPTNQSTLVVGPWLHGGWRSMSGASLGCIGFDTATSETFQGEMQYPFFSHFLRDEGDWEGTEAIVFETGTNEWRRFDRWPPPGVEHRSLYFGADGSLSWDAPSATPATASISASPSAAATAGDASGKPGAVVNPETYDEYISDPAKPVPFSAEYRTTQGHLWMIEDQRFAATRPDVLVYESEVLTEEVTIAGPIIATLHASTSGTDADWIVKLIDVLPGDTPDNPDCPVPMGDFQMLLAGEVFRAKFRNSYESPEPMVPGEPTRIEFDLRDRFHTFKAGHRIMVQVQSSWFPVIDRNPQTFVDIYTATEENFQTATQTIYRSPELPSHLTLGILRRD